MKFLKRFFKNESKKPEIDYDNYKITNETPSDEFLEFVFKYEVDRLHEMASFYKTRNLKKADPSVLTGEKQILEEKCRRLQNAAIDYAFSNHEDSHPDYEKALVYGNIALNEIENALAYQERGFE